MAHGERARTVPVEIVIHLVKSQNYCFRVGMPLESGVRER